jgi:hypothetical protein
MDSKQCSLILKQVVVKMTMVRCMASVTELRYASQDVTKVKRMWEDSFSLAYRVKRTGK